MRLARAQAAVWIALLTIFLALALPVLSRGVRTGYILPATASSSTDAYLTLLESNKALSEGIVGLFGAFSQAKTVVILQRDGDDESSFLSMLIGCLAWPHDIQIVPLSPGTAHRRLASVDLRSAGAIVTCGVPLPPGFPPGIALAQNVRVVLLPEGFSQ